MPEKTVETPVLDLLAGMTADSIEASSLDAETLMLVRIAALVAMDAPPASYLMNLEAAGELEIDPEQIRGVLAAVAPIVGTPRVVAAVSKIVRALEIELDLADARGEDPGGLASRHDGAVPRRDRGNGAVECRRVLQWAGSTRSSCWWRLRRWCRRRR